MLKLDNKGGISLPLIALIGFIVFAMIVMFGMLLEHREKVMNLNVKVTNKPVSEIEGEGTNTDLFKMKAHEKYANMYIVCLDGYQYYVTDKYAGAGMAPKITWDSYEKIMKPVECYEEEWKRK